MPIRPTHYPEVISLQLRGDLALQVRRVFERFEPASLGRLTMRHLCERAIAVGLTAVADELLAACEAVTVRPVEPLTTEPTP